jgi:hypothetical protein
MKEDDKEEELANAVKKTKFLSVGYFGFLLW